jgi:DNA helicase-2/ATP-dependent DNA helicase PcrA
MWNSTVPSRFLDELPEKSVEVTEAKGGWGQPVSRFDRVEPFSSSYGTPGWQRGRAQKNQKGEGGFSEGQRNFKRGPVTINAKAVDRTAPAGGGSFRLGERVFHQKFGYGRVTEVEGNKLTVDFEKAGEKRVVENFLERA